MAGWTPPTLINEQEEWNPCAQNSSTSLTLCVLLKTPKVNLWYTLKINQCDLTDYWIWRSAFHGCCSFSMGPWKFQCPGEVHTPCWALRLNPAVRALGLLRTAPLPEAGICPSSGELCSAWSHVERSLPGWGHHLDTAGPSLPPRAPPAVPHLHLSAQNSRINMIQYLFCH